jgi:fatty-acyl-CoA synthase
MRGGVTFFGGVPTILIRLLEHCGGTPPPLPALRLMMVGGSTVAPSLITAIEQAFEAQVINGYGQSEAPSALQTRPDDTAAVKAMTIGRGNPLREVTILNTFGDPLRPGGVGELCLRGELVMSGYWAQPDQNSGSTVDDAGWLHTGDLASRDAEGVVSLHGRLRDVIIRGGENIYPAEVEAALSAHPGVLDIAVVGAPDPCWGEVPIAFVRPLGPSLDPHELESFARERLAGFKVPRTWHQVEEFPLTASGKIQKFKLTAMLGAAQ